MPDLLQLLPEYVLHWLVQNGAERRVVQGEVLTAEGAKTSSLSIVLDGLFLVKRPGEPHGPGEHVGPGGFLGEFAALQDHTATATVLADEPSLILEVTWAQLRTKLQFDPGFASDFYRALLSAVTAKLELATARLHAAEAAPSRASDPATMQAQHAIGEFKKLMLLMDKEAMKPEGLSEERYREFLENADRLMHVVHSVLGDGSPLSDIQRKEIGARLQHEMLPYILTTHTAERFYSKPRGYAGDYLAIHAIYANEARGTGRLGPVIDRMFLETPPCRAVRNRRAILADEIVRSVESSADGPVRVLCLASGPATEVFDAFARIPDRTRLKATLLDIDLHALAFVDELRAKQRLQSQIVLVNENLIALMLGRSTLRVEPQHLIYSIGLIDYLNDKLVGKLLQFIHANLAPGGRAILGNFHPSNPAREFMEHVLEWNLIHRTEEDMNRLFRESPFRSPCSRVQFEAEGVDLFAECVRQSHAAPAGA